MWLPTVSLQHSLRHSKPLRLFNLPNDGYRVENRLSHSAEGRKLPNINGAPSFLKLLLSSSRTYSLPTKPHSLPSFKSHSVRIPSTGVAEAFQECNLVLHLKHLLHHFFQVIQTVGSF
jgi:hypothetical protein